MVTEAACCARFWWVNPLIKEKNLHRKQFIDCHKRLNASNECIKLNSSKVKQLEKKLLKELEYNLDHTNDLNITINDLRDRTK